MVKQSGIPIKVKKGKATLGASKFGGNPDLPASIKWPKGEEGPLAFICQINFSEFKNTFAAKGMLYFFTVPAPDDLGEEHAVIFYDGDEQLESRKANYEWMEGLVDAELPLPSYKLVVGQDSDAGYSQLFGEGEYIQENLEEEEEGEKNLRLLLQLDAEQFDETFEYICSEDGMIYFLIPDKDLVKKNFKRAYATMQNT